MDTDLQNRLARIMSSHIGQDVEIANVSRFHGGAARETYRFDVTSNGTTQGFVVRRDPSSSLIDTSRAVEFHILQRAHTAGIPAPRPVLLDKDGSHLGSPGFIMHEIPNGRAAAFTDAEPYGAEPAETGRALLDGLGKLHSLVPDDQDYTALPYQDAAARLAHWKSELLAHKMRPEPIAMAAIRWLEAHVPPPSGPPAFVHGDFRSGNFLVDDNNKMLAILDWEMAHIGDPMEDLAWLMDPLWSHGRPDHVAGTIPQTEAIQIWEESSGRKFDPQLFRWWQLFSGVEGLAIWITSANEVAQKRTFDPVMTFAAVLPYRAHNVQVAHMLKAFSA